MKDPMLEALRRLKAKRVAIVIADAKDLGLDDEQTPDADSLEGRTEFDESERDIPEGKEESAPGSRDDRAELDNGQDDEEMDFESEAERVMGRKPFSKVGRKERDSGEDIDDETAAEMIDERVVNRVKSSGRRPKNLRERAQMMLAEKFKK